MYNHATMAGKERFETRPTHLHGVSLRTEPGVEVDILRKTVEVFSAASSEYVRNKRKIDALGESQKPLDKGIKKTAQEHEGLRGVEDENENFILSVFPRKSTTYDQELLRQALGDAYSAVVHEDVSVVITLPQGVNRETVQKSLVGALLKSKINAGDLEKILSVRIDPRIDEEVLDQKIKDGSVVLPEGAKTEKITWAITVAPLKEVKAD